jgi:hypothetical protein
MKTYILSTCILLIFLSPSDVLSQYIAIQDGSKVEIRNIDGGFTTSGFYSGVKEIAQGESFVVFQYESGNVEIRDYDLKYLASAYYSKLNHVDAMKDWVVLYYENGKIEVRDKNLRIYSSWFK